MVTIAVIAILASLLLPALGRAKNQARTAVCLSQQKQFGYAWVMYSMENDERIPPNHGYLGPTFPLEEGSWVYGWLDNDSSRNWWDNINTTYLTESLLAPYLSKSVGVWRCPSDQSSSIFDSGRLPRVRSYSMNNFLNSVDHGPDDPWRMPRKMTDLVDPAPATTFVTIDEREDSIQDSVFVVDMYNPGPALASLPRAAHQNGGTLSFGDGHSVHKRWLDPRTRPPIQKRGNIGISNSGPPDVDVLWLRQHTTGSKLR